MAKARAVEIERAEKVRRMKEELEKKMLAESNEDASNGGVITNEEREKIQQLVDEMVMTEVISLLL